MAENPRWLRNDIRMQYRDEKVYTFDGDPVNADQRVTIEVTIDLVSDEAAQRFLGELRDLTRKYGAAPRQEEAS